MKPVDLLVEHGYVVTMDADRKVYADGGVAVRGREIVAVGPSADLEGWEAATVVDAAGMLVLPGLIDAHDHPVLRPLEPRAAGMWPPTAENNVLTLGGDMPGLLAWTRTAFAGELSPDQAYAVASARYLEALKSGVTCVNDHGGAHHDEVARAALDIGIRGIVTRYAVDLAPAGGDGALERCADADELAAAAEATIDRWHGRGDGRLRAWPSAVMAMACSDELWRNMKALADRRGVGVTTHAACVKHENDACVAAHGRRVVERLHDLGVLGRNLSCGHLGFVSDEEIGWLAACGVKATHCPGTTTWAAHGIVATGAVPKLLAAGIDVGLGTDTCGHMQAQLTLAGSVHKDRTLDATVLDAPRVLEMATIGGARTCLWDDEIGSLEVGKRADLIVVDRSSLRWQPDLEPVRVFVELGSPEDVDTVVVDGRIVVRSGELQTLDEADVKRRLLAAAAGLSR